MFSRTPTSHRGEHISFWYDGLFAWQWWQILQLRFQNLRKGTYRVGNFIISILNVETYISISANWITKRMNMKSERNAIVNMYHEVKLESNKRIPAMPNNIVPSNVNRNICNKGIRSSKILYFVALHMYFFLSANIYETEKKCISILKQFFPFNCV